jgi:Tol biopolymer transport system component
MARLSGPERFQRLNAIVDAALELPAGERETYLAEACGADTGLRNEVVALLEAHCSGQGFLDVPALHLLASDMSPPPVTSDLTGRRIQKYEIISHLGAGGIGEVWLAQDTELPRKVAIKLLSPTLAMDSAHVRRFQQEARSASLLSHPNIITIYEIGKWEGIDFIAEEFVPGETLRERMRNRRLETAEVLDIGSQIAAALAAAHEAGIVHRDIKPENVMVRPDGLVKVLDFGLARFVDHSATNDSLSRPGAVLGTVRYMSPEQARGLPLEARSDIFSLGVVLYEMLAGRTPFIGPTTTDVLGAILYQDPPPFRNLSVAVAADLEAIVHRCLQKDVAARYPSASKLRRGLRNIARGFAPMETPADELGGTPFKLTQEAAGRRNRLALPVWAALVAIVMVAAGIVFVARDRRSGAALDNLTFSRLATRGQSTGAAISQDGKYVAYVLRTETGESIWTAQLESGSDVQALAPEPGEHVGLKFSPNGAYLFYRLNRSTGEHDLYRVPALGGSAVKIMNDVPGSIAISPDGKRLATVRIDPVRVEASLVVANADGSEVHTVRTKRQPAYYSRNGLAWSPDGSSVACFTGESTSFDTRAFRLVSIRIADGSERQISSETWAWVESMAWSGSGFIAVNASRERQDAYQIWLVPVSRRSAMRVTNDLSSYSRITLSGDGMTLAALQGRRDIDIWVAPLTATERGARIALANVHGLNSLAWTPDSRIVFTALTGERRNIWVMDADGGNQRQITAGPSDKEGLSVTPDGRYLIYSSRAAIWRMDLDGSNPLQLTRRTHDVHPVASPDSRFVFYASFRNWSPAIWGKPTIWRVPIDGGEPLEIVKEATTLPRVSPDGTKVACNYYVGPNPEHSASPLAVFSAADGRPLQVFDKISVGGRPIFWTPDGNALIYPVRAHGVGNLWRQPLAGGLSVPATDFLSGELFSYALSADSKTVAMARGKEATDIVLIRGFQ